MLLAPTLANFALTFGPPEYFSLMLMGMVVVTYLVGAPWSKALMMACFGIILGAVGMDPISGQDPVHVRTARTDGRHRC